MGLSPSHIVILAIVAVLLLGGGRFSNIMTDLAKGVKGFKKSMAEEEEEDAARPIPRLSGTPTMASTVERERHTIAADQPIG